LSLAEASESKGTLSEEDLLIGCCILLVFVIAKDD